MDRARSQKERVRLNGNGESFNVRGCAQSKEERESGGSVEVVLIRRSEARFHECQSRVIGLLVLMPGRE